MRGEMDRLTYAGEYQIGKDGGDGVGFARDSLAAYRIRRLDARRECGHGDHCGQEIVHAVLADGEDLALLRIRAGQNRDSGDVARGAARIRVGHERHAVHDGVEAQRGVLDGRLDGQRGHLAEAGELRGGGGAVQRGGEFAPGDGAVASAHEVGHRGLATLDDGGAERWVLWARDDEEVGGHGTGGLAGESHLLGVSSEGHDVALDPVKGQALVEEAEVLGGLGELWRVGEAEGWEYGVSRNFGGRGGENGPFVR